MNVIKNELIEKNKIMPMPEHIYIYIRFYILYELVTNFGEEKKIQTIKYNKQHGRLMKERKINVHCYIYILITKNVESVSTNIVFVQKFLFL